jgi:hypothetical protein
LSAPYSSSDSDDGKNSYSDDDDESDDDSVVGISLRPPTFRMRAPGSSADEASDEDEGGPHVREVVSIG